MTTNSKGLLESAVEAPKSKISVLKEEEVSGDATIDLSKTIDETLEKSTKRKRESVFAAAKASVDSSSSTKSAKMMDLRLDRNSPTLRPLNTSLTSLSRRVSLEKNEMVDYEKWLAAAAKVPEDVPKKKKIFGAEARKSEDFEKWLTAAAALPELVPKKSKLLGSELRMSLGERRLSIGDFDLSMGDKRASLGDLASFVGDRSRSSVGERRLSIGDAPVSHLLDTLKQDVEAAKLKEKMFEIDLMNMLASDDVV